MGKYIIIDKADLTPSILKRSVSADSGVIVSIDGTRAIVEMKTKVAAQKVADVVPSASVLSYSEAVAQRQGKSFSVPPAVAVDAEPPPVEDKNDLRARAYLQKIGVIAGG